MTPYSVHVICNGCSNMHPMPIQIDLLAGPPDKASIGDTYAGKDLPPQVAMLVDNRVECPETGKMFSQEDKHQMFLVPER